ALQGWISKVAELDERRTLLGGCREVHKQSVGEHGLSQGDARSANGKPSAEEYAACGAHNILPLCYLLAMGKRVRVRGFSENQDCPSPCAKILSRREKELYESPSAAYFLSDSQERLPSTISKLPLPSPLQSQARPG